VKGSEEFGDGRVDNILQDPLGKLLPVGKELPENIPGQNGTPQIHGMFHLYLVI
jgi:hypothetical protein